VRDVVGVDRRQQAHHHDHHEQHSERERDPVAPQADGRKPIGAGSRPDLLALLGREERVRRVAAGGGGGEVLFDGHGC
jgi:hypothetical protein